LALNTFVGWSTGLDARAPPTFFTKSKAGFTGAENGKTNKNNLHSILPHNI
jgi:hypothetical protein